MKNSSQTPQNQDALCNEPHGENAQKNWISNAFQDFFAQETSGAIVMLIATAVALVIANTNSYSFMHEFWNAKFGLISGSDHFVNTVEAWLNDGLMAIFFFVVGLEIKREFIVGELSTFKKAILPVIAALGGMMAPALIYFAINHGTIGAHGWGIPMATDIAFSLGICALLSDRIPHSMKVFLSALAVADDIGAIVVIGIFYSSNIHWAWLAFALVPLAGLIIMNKAKVYSILPYVVMTIVLWYAFLNSGIHATLAGVIAAMCIPASARISVPSFIKTARKKLGYIEETHVAGTHVLECEKEQSAAYTLADLSYGIVSPLQRLEHAILPFSNFIILPLFALANAEVRFVGQAGGFQLGRVGLGVYLGLVLGKPLGIFTVCWLGTKLKLLSLPSDMNYRHLLGAGMLAGIGFTMSIFVSNIAFSGKLAPAEMGEAKIAILLASLSAGILGSIWLTLVNRPKSARPSVTLKR